MIEQDDKKIIVVIGDIMLDEYVFGTVSRVSPESCCPILLSQHKSIQLGGAANVAFQIHKLERSVMLIGIVGNDECGRVIIKELANNFIDANFLFKHKSITTKKTRNVNDVHQQMFRVDYEEQDSLDANEINSIIEFLNKNAERIGCIVLSDYNKGVLTNDSCQTIINAANANKIHTIVDIKVPDANKYRQATVIKGNLKEVTAFFSLQDRNIDECLAKLRQVTKTSYAAVTLGKNGIKGIDQDDNIITHQANQVMVYDVTGAGDIVTAYIAVLFDTMPFGKVLEYANKAAEIKVTKFGNSHVTFDELYHKASKVKKTDEVSALTRDKRVVFTNGCFDIIHAGHVDLLQYAKSKGDILVVGLNTDESIKRLKGNGRPINSLEMRIKVLSAIDAVDFIVCFDDDTPEKIIHEIKPSILIKGGDYAKKDIVGADYVLERGGVVEAKPFCYNVSTTKILTSL